MKLFITGHARHGKDTVAEYLRDNFGFTFTSSSLFVAQGVVRPYLESKGTYYSSLDDCYQDRVNRRSEWYDAIRLFTKNDPSRLSKMLLRKYDLYVGIRSAEELSASRHLADLVIWVDASQRLPPEGGGSISIDSGMVDVIIQNNGTLYTLYRKLDSLGKVLGTPNSKK